MLKETNNGELISFLRPPFLPTLRPWDPVGVLGTRRSYLGVEVHPRSVSSGVSGRNGRTLDPPRTPGEFGGTNGVSGRGPPPARLVAGPSCTGRLPPRGVRPQPRGPLARTPSGPLRRRRPPRPPSHPGSTPCSCSGEPVGVWDVPPVSRPSTLSPQTFPKTPTSPDLGRATPGPRLHVRPDTVRRNPSSPDPSRNRLDRNATKIGNKMSNPFDS